MQSSLFPTENSPSGRGCPVIGRAVVGGLIFFSPLGCISTSQKFSFFFSVDDWLPPSHSGVSYSGLPVSAAATSPALLLVSPPCVPSILCHPSPFPQQFPFPAVPSCSFLAPSRSFVLSLPPSSCSFWGRPLCPPTPRSRAPLPPPGSHSSHFLSPPPQTSRVLCPTEIPRVLQVPKGVQEEGTGTRARVDECQPWLTHRIVSALLSSGVLLPELQPQSESVISTRSFKINTGLHFSFRLFIVVLLAVGWEQIAGGTLTLLGAGK